MSKHSFHYTFHEIAGSSIINSTYSSALTQLSNRFYRTGNTNYFYYQAINITVRTTGNFTFRSDASFDAYGYLYITKFDSQKLSTNRLVEDDDSAGSQQFKLLYTLQSTMKYILVITTYSPAVKGSFRIIATGPSSVTFDDQLTSREVVG